MPSGASHNPPVEKDMEIGLLESALHELRQARGGAPPILSPRLHPEASTIPEP